MMRPFALTTLCFFALFAGEALAHRVNVFAFVDGGEVRVECGFGGSQKVKNGKLVVEDLETGSSVLEGVTDAEGVFRFRPSDAFLATGHGLLIRLIAGEGHQSEWKLPAAELLALSGSGTAPQPGAAVLADAPVDTAALEAMLDKMLDEKLFSVKRALARQQDRAPELRDIIGGIGWILGLLGLATYMKYRR